VKVEATRSAIRYVTARDANVYVWPDSTQLMQATTTKPEGIAFSGVRGPGFTVFVAEGLRLGEWLRLQRDFLPPWRLTVVWQEMPEG
jgi:hypothetical protein